MDFQTFVNQIQEEIENTDMSGGWNPPVLSKSGTNYNCKFVGLSGDTKIRKSDNQQFGLCLLSFVIVDGEYKDRDFTISYSTLAPFKMGPLFSLASMLTRDTSHTINKKLLPALKALDPFIGKVIIEVVGQKDRNDYFTPTFNRVISRDETPTSGTPAAESEVA
jgi:hypothetical protein